MAKRIAVVLILIGLVPLVRFGQVRLQPPQVELPPEAWHARNELLTRAKVRGQTVMPPPAVPASCTYIPKPTHGTTPKFDCRLEDGTVVKVKYGNTPEIAAETAATALLTLLGFPSDYVTIVPRLRCFGCPPSPFRLRQAAEWFFASGLLDRLSNPSRGRDFEWSAVQWKFNAPAVEPNGHEGWQWSDLADVSEARGGATRAELDALRLIAVLLADWDNKSENQRIVCLDTGRPPAKYDDAASCGAPLLMLQDLGATFGPTKLNLAKWRAVPIWTDAAACRTDMASLPYHGATFVPVQISEAGRALLAQQLERIPEAQIRQLFTSAGFPDSTGRPGGDVTEWVRAYEEKVRQIVDRPACPSLA